jgi:type VI secretion system protein
MSLTLKITSYQSQVLGADGCKVFSNSGGSVGRAQDNAWVLPDPERFISGCHFTISLNNGMCLLTDTSTNGVYINDSATPVGNGNSVALNDGDRLKFGDYEVEASIDADSGDSDPLDTWPDQNQHGDDRLGFGAAGAHSLPASADPLDFGSLPDGDDYDPFEVPTEQPLQQAGAAADHSPSIEGFFKVPEARNENTPEEIIPEKWYEDTSFPDVCADRKDDALLQQPPVQEIPDESPVVPAPVQAAQPAPPPIATAPRQIEQPQPAEHVGAGGSVDDLYAIFLQGAGLDLASAGQVDAREAMRNYGQLFRTVVQGMMEVLMARASLKSEFRMSLTTIRPVENNPLKFSPGIDDAMRNLFLSQGSGYLSPVDAVKEGFEDIKCHQMAMMAGMQAAFAEMMRTFSPEIFEDIPVKGGARAALMSVNKKARNWEAYCEFYSKVTQDADSSFQQLFGEHFAIAYEEQIRRLSLLKSGK